MRRELLAVLATALLAGVLWAASESNEALPPAALVDYRGSLASPLDGADSMDWSAPLSNSPTAAARTLIPTDGNPSLHVAVDHSVSGGTVCVHAGLWQRRSATDYRFLGIAAVQTLTSSTDTRAPGRYLANEIMYVDTGPATHVELRKEDPSDSGTVTLVPFMGNSAPRGAGSD